MRKPIISVVCKVHNKKVYLSWNLRPQNGPVCFSIYRKGENRFAFGADNAEYFFKVTSRGARRIFKGKLNPQRGRHFSFIDRQVKVGITYSYFIQVNDKVKIGPYPVKVRDPLVWWPYAYMVNRLKKAARQYSRVCKLTWCGETANGIPLPLMTIGTGRKTIVLVGTVHAGESGPELMVPALEYLLKHCRDLLKKVTIAAIPSVNIDSREKLVAGTPWYLRKNHQGVDLNRNFLTDWEKVNYAYGLDSSDPDSATYRGPSPASAPETRAIMEVITRKRPTVVLCFHWLASICGFPIIAYKGRDKGFRQQCIKLARLYYEGLYPEDQWDDKYLHWSAVGGCITTWLYKKGKVPCFDMEGGARKVEVQRAKRDLTDRALLREYQKRHQQALVRLIEYL